MNAVPVEQEIILGPDSAGVRMTPEEFDAVEEFDENYCYELVNGVLVVGAIPLAEETGPNDLLGRLLRNYQATAIGSAMDYTMPQQYIRVGKSRRLADRVIWTGLGRYPNPKKDLPTIAVEFVSAGRTNHQRDYVDKRQDYMEAGISEYWIIDRFQRTLTVIHNLPTGQRQEIISENQTYESPLLPGFKVPLGQLLAEADKLAQTD